mgnify:CR=1 FL=1
MSSITQTVPSYNNGISQQHDSLKLPGQVSVAQNVLPDITEGLQKRPGSRLVSSLSDDGTASNNSTANGKWFSYYRDEQEQYLGQIARDGTVRMWTVGAQTVASITYPAGSPMAVYWGTGTTATTTTLKAYLEHSKDDDLQMLTLNDYTYVTNRAAYEDDGTTKHTKTDVEMTATVEAARPPEAYIELKKISYASQYAVNLYDNTNETSITTATRIKVQRVNDSSNGCVSGGGLSGLPEGGYYCTTGNSRDSYCPNVDTQLFNVDYGDSGDTTDANGQSWTYSGAVNGGTASDRKNMYFRIVTIGQSVPEGGNATNPDYHCRYTTTHDLLYGGEGWVTGDYFYTWMKNAKYKITVQEHSTAKVKANLAAARPSPTPYDNETTITAESILGSLETEIIAGGTFTDANITQIGNGLYVTRASNIVNDVEQNAFNISTPVSDLLSVFTDSVNSIDELPSQCKHGYVIKIANSVEDEDDWYVKFIGKDGKDGSGVWEECPKPGRKVEFDANTMPIQIARKQDDGSGTVTGTAYKIYFDVNINNWEDALVGDENTNSEPSFVGKKINKMLFFRNRLVLFSDENVVLSQAGEFFNFWNKTALAFSNIDPIDLKCSSDKPAIIWDAIAVNAGLVMFTKTQQFMLTTDSDILSPNTAKINNLANYNFNSQTSPISLGTTIGWLDNAGKNSRFFEMQRTMREGEPEIVEQSKIVSKLFNKDLRYISNSRENGIIFFSEDGSDTLYCYRYFSSSDKRIQQAWFTWKLPGAIQHHAVLDDSLYIVIRNDSKDALLRFDIKLHSDSRTVVDDLDTTDTSDDITYRVHFDNSRVIAASALGYSATTGRTGFTKPDGFNVTTTTTSDDYRKLAVYCHSSGDQVGRYAEASVVGNPGNYNIEFDGDWTGQDLIVGYLYDYEVQLPTIYVQKQEGDKVRSDTQGSLVVHRIKLNLGNAGLYETLIERTGKPDYTELWEPAKADNYNANQVDFVEAVTQTVPTYEKNTNLTLTLKSTHPAPATLHSMSWEGDYTNRFYQRV